MSNPPERPQVLWKDGHVIEWSAGTTHLWGELATRGSNVFEGIRAIRTPHGAIRVIELERHLNRLFRSARMLQIPTDQTPESIRVGIINLLGCLPSSSDYYIRPTLCLEEGRWETDPQQAVVSSYVVAVPIAPYPPAPARVRCTIGSYNKLPASVFPSRIKSGAVYLISRLPMLDARARGFDEAILLGDQGQVAETTGSSIIGVHDGELLTPGLDDGILDSITRRRILILAREAGMRVHERKVRPDELLDCDEVMLVGTLSGIVSVQLIDKLVFGDVAGPVTTQLYSAYLDLVASGTDLDFTQELSPGGLR